MTARNSCKDVCVAMDCDYDSNEFYSEGQRRARKQYKCCECSAPILPGELYQYAVGKSDGDMFTARTCAVCAEIRKAFCCDGWIFGELWESVTEQLFPYWNEMMAIDCLARLTTDAATNRMREAYKAYRKDHDA